MADVAAMDIVIGADVGKAVTGFNLVQRELAQTAVAAQKTDSSFDKLSKGSGQATNALMNMGRIVQDAPFGFIAIQNNLNPMLESFQRLQKESGSTGSALKSLGKELIGPAGLGIALSVVSAIIIKYPDLLSLVSKEAALAAKNQKDYTDAMASSIAPAQTQITTLNNLLSIARDSSQSLQTQKNAIAEINRLYPERLKFLNQENINSSAAKEAIDKVTQSLILQAQAQAASNLLTKANEALMKAQNGELSDNVDNWDAFFLGLKNVGNLTNTVADLQKKAAANQKTAINDATKQQEKYSEVLKGIQAQLAKIGGFTPPPPPKDAKGKTIDEVFKDTTKALKDFNTEQTKVGGDFRDNMIKAIDSAITQLIKLGADAEGPMIQGLLNTEKGIKQTINTVDDLSNALVNLREKIDIPKIKDVTPDRLTRGPSLTIDTPAITEATKGMQFLSDNMEAIKKDTGDVQNAFENMFTAMAEGGPNAIKIVIQSLEQMVIKMVAAVAAAALLAVILNSISFGGSSLGSLMGLGKGFKGIFGGLLHFAEGAIVTGPTRALIGEAGPEVVFPLDRLREFIQPAGSQVVVLETRVRGSDIWLSQSRTNGRRNRTY